MENNNKKGIYRDKDGNYIICEEKMAEILDLLDDLFEGKKDKKPLLERWPDWPDLDRDYCCHALTLANTIHDKKFVPSPTRATSQFMCQDWVYELNGSNPDLQLHAGAVIRGKC
ncbi:hypothetical protein [Psychrobacillus sp. FJAT-21963]|uniref:hypothetical protein n=1 Tax=Psychrobacillus sp. FJAT-21963 TaxID=1712028 RepID=UPI0006F99E41|nr:hypothetical protein [Psychrobacillus sp. FJAT-21963]KQL34442.1 hypothetical protein AN959_15740 [Psychrobacillus sp. FJAT-21963]